MLAIEHDPILLIKDRFLGRGGGFKETTPRWLPRLLGLMPVYRNVPVYSLIQEATALSNRHYDFGIVSITLWHSSVNEQAFDIPCNGLSGDNGISFIFYSQHPRFRKKSDLYRAVAETLPPLVAHELGHLARSREGNGSNNFYEMVVHEVAAMHLQTAVYPNVLVPPVSPTEEQIQFLEAQLKKVGSRAYTDAALPQWCYGREGFPVRGLYRLAKGWLDRYNQNPNPDFKYLFEVPAEELIKQVAPHTLS